MDRFLTRSIIFLLFFTAFTPLIYTMSLVFPFVTGKAFFFRTLVELSLILFFWLLIIRPQILSQAVQLLRRPLVLLVLLFGVSCLLSTLFAYNSHKAFFGDVERMEGLIGMMHYFAYFGLLVLFFDRKTWMRFLAISLGVGAIVGVYGLLHYFKVEHFPFLPFTESVGKINSFLGNSSYIGTHFLFMIAFSGMFLLHSRRLSVAWILSGLMGIFSLIVLFIIRNRGSFVGLTAGIIALALYGVFLTFKRDDFLAYRKWVFCFLGLLVVCGSLFFMTKSLPLWQSIPGVDKIAVTDFDDTTVKTRLISLGVSLHAFKDRPFFGWGLDNFNIAYNTHFNPEHMIYEQEWFDRAHNKMADLFVMQGLFGLLVFLCIFGYVAVLLVRSHDYRVSIPLLFLTVAYIVHSVFLFDQINSYIIVYLFLACVAVLFGGDVKKEYPLREVWGAQWLWVVWMCLIIGLLFSLYFLNWVPLQQSRYFIKGNISRDAREIDRLSDLYLSSYYNFTQGFVRQSFVEQLSDAESYSNKDLDFLTFKSIKALEQFVTDQPDDPRLMIRLAEMYTDLEKREKTGMYGELAEQWLLRALELAPERQMILYQLAYNYSAEHRYDEAITFARRALALSDQVARSHYILGIILTLAGDEYREEGLREILQAYTLRGFSLSESDEANLEYVFSSDILFFSRLRKADLVIASAEKLQKMNSDIATDLQKVIDWAREGEWGSVDTFLNQAKIK